MTSTIPVMILCASGTAVCKQRVSHFFKFNENNVASCVWCQEKFEHSLRSIYAFHGSIHEFNQSTMGFRG